ncbi:MAG: glycosyltransferase family A protein [Rhizomicrobium sp.]
MTVAVSVITPTKNRLALLCQTMDSVQRQSLTDWEHVIVDDGSNDGTEEEVRKRAAADPRIRLIRRTGTKTGANVCRNIGIRESRADLIVLLDSDDFLRSECLERRVKLMRRNADLDFSVFRAGVYSKKLGDMDRLFHEHPHGDDLLRFLAHECVWEITGPIWRKNFLEKIGGFDEALLSMQDLELHVRAICAGGRYICLPDVDHDIGWQYDFTRTSVRHIYDPAYIEAAEGIRAKLFDNVQRSGLMTWSRQRALVGLCFEAAESWAMREKRLGKSLLVWYRGCRLQQVSLRLQLGGIVMLCVSHWRGNEDGFFARLVNKWRGWVRFRQEPALLKPTNALK